MTTLDPQTFLGGPMLRSAAYLRATEGIECIVIDCESEAMGRLTSLLRMRIALEDMRTAMLRGDRAGEYLTFMNMRRAMESLEADAGNDYRRYRSSRTVHHNRPMIR